MASIKIEKLQKRIMERAAALLLHDLNDPRMGFVTVTRVKLARDLRHCIIFVSVLGPEAERSRILGALDHARGYVQKRIAETLNTRATPTLSFKYDESVEGSVRVSKLIDEITREREESEGETDEGDDGQAPHEE